MEKYTKQIYVQVEDADNGDNCYLMAYRDKESVENGEVAIYQFVGLAKKTTTLVIE